MSDPRTELRNMIVEQLAKADPNQEWAGLDSDISYQEIISLADAVMELFRDVKPYPGNAIGLVATTYLTRPETYCSQDDPCQWHIDRMLGQRVANGLNLPRCGGMKIGNGKAIG